MNANQLKLVACLSMLLDHIGYLLFPQVEWLRWCGRLAMPLFAYLVAEGCLHTRNRWRYFLRILGLALLCQLGSSLESVLYGGGDVYLNVLFTLSAGQLLCFVWLDFTDAVSRREEQAKAAGRLLLLVAAVVLVCTFGERMKPLVGVSMLFDYGLSGIFLPLFALLGRTKVTRLLTFSGGILWMCLSFCRTMPFIWLAFLALPLLAMYNGRQGDRRWQYAFYAFYPLHLVVLYGVRFLF